MEVWQRIKQRLEDFCKSEVDLEIYGGDRQIENTAIAGYAVPRNRTVSCQEGLNLLEIQKILYASPIWLVVAEILELGLESAKSIEITPEISPLYVLLGVPEDDMPFEQIRLKLEHICDTYTQKARPVKFLVGTWFSHKFCGEKAIATLFSVLKTEPVLVFDTISEGFDSFSLHIGYWDANSANYSYHFQQIERILEQKDQSLTETSISLINFKQNWYQLIPDFVAIWLCLKLDQYFLLSAHRRSPLLLELLPELLGGFPDAEVKDLEKLVIHRFQNLYAILGSSAALNLDLAICLSRLEDKSLANQKIILSMQQQLEDWGVSSEHTEIKDSINSFNFLLNLIQSAFYVTDWDYIKKLNEFLNSINSDRRLNLVDAFFREEFEFTVVKMNAQGQIKRSRPTKAKFLSQILDDNTKLDMVYIPNGIFQMGSAGTEAGREVSESPMHWVAVSGFFMGRFPITQSQWQAVAQFPAINHQLVPDPSFFKGANRPVENISWFEAVEFCDRLTQKTGINYHLPSEAEWEYACRAGSKTPFHFGYTISPEVANYDATYAYGYGSQGEYRQETTTVGSFDVANSYGLYDMHGLVLEWCADTWHENYRNAPADAKPWMDDSNSHRVLRGGSWYMVAGLCRSAARFKYLPDVWLNHIGFRIAMSM